MHYISRIWLLLALVGLALAAGCDTDDGGIDVDGGADAGDTDEQQDCPVNSGWPCACGPDVGTWCEDGSYCVEMALDGGGAAYFCSEECAGEGDDCPSTPYPPEGQCDLYADDADIWLCVLHCIFDDDCPPGQSCTGWGLWTICLPPEEQVD